jgi:hypothetical protein
MTNEPKLYSPTKEIIENLLFEQVERPKRTVSVQVVNIYENRYRINIWVKYTEDNLDKVKIGASYFAFYKSDGTLTLK